MLPNEAIVEPVTVDPWPADGIGLAFEASPAACRALARRLDLVAVRKLAGDARIDRLSDGMIRLRGRFEADVVQSCVVSLEDVPATVAESFECRFAPAGSAILDDLAWDQDVEPLEASELDLGEVFAQQLSVALDPYPRAAGADDLLSRELGHHIAFDQDKPVSPLAAALMERQGAVEAAPPRQGRE